MEPHFTENKPKVQKSPLSGRKDRFKLFDFRMHLSNAGIFYLKCCHDEKEEGGQMGKREKEREAIPESRAFVT